MGAANLILVAWLAGVLVTTGLLALLWWALFADRSRGRHRCPRCWHRIDLATGLRCPECGHTSRGERDLLRTRRRWWIAAASLGMLLAGTIWLRTVIADRGWWTVLPHRITIAVLPWVPSPRQVTLVRQHMLDELQAGRMSPEDSVRMLETVKSGGFDLPPGSDGWRSTYVRWLSALEDRYAASTTGADDPLRLAAIALPPVVQMSVPERWWRDQPLVGMVAVEDWWPDGVRVRMRVQEVQGLPVQPEATERLRRTTWTRAGHDPSDGSRDAFAIDLGPIAAGSHQGTLTLAWEATDTLGSARVSTRGVVRLPVSVQVEGDAPPLPPVRDPAMDELMRRVFDDGILRRETHPPQFAFSYAPFETSGQALEDVAFGLVVEACEAGTPRRSLRVWWRGGVNRAQLGWEPPVEDAAAMLRLGDGAGWTLRIRGDPVLARRAAAGGTASVAARWWDGTIEVPLRVQSIRSGAGRAPWRASVDPPEPAR